MHYVVKYLYILMLGKCFSEVCFSDDLRQILGWNLREVYLHVRRLKLFFKYLS